MIYYFSGTGNSKWVAEELALLTGDEAQDIAKMNSDGPTAVFAGEGARIGIVYPVYAWGAPLIVEDFCRRMKLDAGAYAYAVCTCGDEAGRAMRHLKRLFAFQSAWSLAMPNNYIMGFDVDSPELEQRKISQAREKLKQIAQLIESHNSVYDVHEGPVAGLKTLIVRPLFNTFARRTSPFSVDDTCNACGLCARICPVQAISIQNGKPVWVKKQCAQCTGCINRCPQRAIQFGAGTAKRGRYYMKTGHAI